MSFTRMFVFTFTINLLFHLINAANDTCYEGICIPNDYSKFERPLQNQVLKVQMIFSEIQIMEIDDMKSIIRMYIYMDYKWPEPRITGPEKVLENIPLNHRLKHLLWRPDFYIEDLYSSERQLYLDTDQRTEHLWLEIDNLLDLDLGFRCAVTCRMRFDAYPFDSHDCHLKIASWTFNLDNLLISVK